MEKYLSVYDCMFYNNKMIMCDFDTNILAEWNLATNTYRTISRLMPIGKYEEVNKFGLFINLFNYGDYIYCVQRNTAQIVEVDIKTGLNVRYGRHNKIFKHSDAIYRSSIMVEGNLYLLPYAANRKITIFNIYTKQYSEILSPAEFLGTEFLSLLNDKKIYTYICDGSKVWFAIEETDIVAEIDLQTKLLEREMHCYGNKLYKIDGDKENIFAIGEACKGLYSVSKEGIFTKIIDKEDTVINNINIVKYIGNKLFIEKKDGCTYVIEDSRRTYKIIFPQTFHAIKKVRNIDIPFVKWVYRNEKLYLLPFSSNGMITIDVNTLETTHYELTINGNDVIRENSKRGEVLIECEKSSIRDFIDLIEIR